MGGDEALVFVKSTEMMIASEGAPSADRRRPERRRRPSGGATPRSR
jgi:hypothetical protein